MKTMSERIAERSRKRIEKFVGRKDLGTTDPLRAEIDMAQLDALSSISYAIREATVEFRLLREDLIVISHDLYATVGKRPWERRERRW